MNKKWFRLVNKKKNWFQRKHSLPSSPFFNSIDKEHRYYWKWLDLANATCTQIHREINTYTSSSDQINNNSQIKWYGHNVVVVVPALNVRIAIRFLHTMPIWILMVNVSSATKPWLIISDILAYSRYPKPHGLMFNCGRANANFSLDIILSALVRFESRCSIQNLNAPRNGQSKW